MKQESKRITVGEAVQEYVGNLAVGLLKEQQKKTGSPINIASTGNVIMPDGTIKPLTQLTEEECGSSKYIKRLRNSALGITSDPS